MFRLTYQWLLKSRPENVSVTPGSNILLEPNIMKKAMDVFAIPEFPRKRVMHNWRFFIKAGKATTGPPIGQEFSKLGLKAMDFVKSFNDRTKAHFKDDVELIVRIQVYFDKTYIYRIEPPPTAWFLLRAVRLKRRDSGPVGMKSCFCGLITLEMIYEIAKMKQFNWSKPEEIPIETRVRQIAGQAYRMGIAIIGVHTPSSPVKGITTKEYELDCKRYREIHMKQWREKEMKKQSEAPFYERLHTPDLSSLSDLQLEEGLVEANLFSKLWIASHPESSYMSKLKDRELALKHLNMHGWLKDMNVDDIKRIFFNKKVANPINDTQYAQPFWSRDENSHTTQ